MNETPAQDRAPQPGSRVFVRAAALMLASTIFFGLMAVTIRLASETLSTFEIAFFRNFFGLGNRKRPNRLSNPPFIAARTHRPPAA